MILAPVVLVVPRTRAGTRPFARTLRTRVQDLQQITPLFRQRVRIILSGPIFSELSAWDVWLPPAQEIILGLLWQVHVLDELFIHYLILLLPGQTLRLLLMRRQRLLLLLLPLLLLPLLLLPLLLLPLLLLLLLYGLRIVSPPPFLPPRTSQMYIVDPPQVEEHANHFSLQSPSRAPELPLCPSTPPQHR